MLRRGYSTLFRGTNRSRAFSSVTDSIDGPTSKERYPMVRRVSLPTNSLYSTGGEQHISMWYRIPYICNHMHCIRLLMLSSPPLPNLVLQKSSKTGPPHFKSRMINAAMIILFINQYTKDGTRIPLKYRKLVQADDDGELYQKVNK